MLFGCCVNMLPKKQDDPGFWYAPEVRQAGFDYIELPIGQVVGISEASFAESISCLRDLHLPVLACNNYFPGSIKLIGPAADPVRIREHYHAAMERARRLGSSIVVFGSPWSKFRPEGVSPEQAFEQMVFWCREMAPVAQTNGITIALEPNNRTETNMINRYCEVAALAKTADHPNIRCLQDFFHLRMEEDTVDSMLETGSEWLVHTHFARLDGRGFPRSHTEDPGYRTFFSALKQLGYQGGLSMEGFPESRESFPAEAAQTCAFLRACAREAGI